MIKSRGVSQGLVGIALAILVGLGAWFAWVGDDAFIAFRYGRNLADGYGFVFNPTDTAPVEGFTQLAWILIVAGVEWLGIEVVAGTRVIELAIAVGLAWYWSRVAARGPLGVGAVGATVGLFLLVTSPGYVIWSTGGLGTILFVLAVFACVERMLKAGLADKGAGESPLLAACFATVVLTFVRFDGVYFAGVIVASGVTAALLAKHRRLALVSIAAGASGAVAVALQSLWRWSYFGDWVPNTVYAKGGMSAKTLERGLDYVLSSWMTVPLLCVALLLSIAYGWRHRRTEPALVVIAGILIGTTLYGLLVGGDFMPMGRFFVPALPFVALVIGRLCKDLWEERGRGHAGLAVTGALVLSVPALFDVSLFPRELREAHTFRWGFPEYQSEARFLNGVMERAEEWSQFGKALALHAEPGDSLVRGAVGAMSYYSDLTVYDRFGLTDREAALNTKHNPETLTMPGHDSKAVEGFFNKRNPTWIGGGLLLGEQPGTETYKLAREAAYAGLIDLFEVGPEDGFPERGIIVMRRYLPSAETVNPAAVGLTEAGGVLEPSSAE
ncbi:MAG: arabinofuranosyltransferase [Bacteroidia bacterium]|jgi:hypothetical protein